MSATPGAWKDMDGTPTRLVLIRHGEVEEQFRKILYGQMDVKLSPGGEEQSRLTGEALAAQPLAAVYTSDLYRASRAGEEIARRHGIEPRPTPALRERHFGHWQGLPWDEIEAHHPEEYVSYMHDRFTFRVGGGAENFEDVRARVLAFLEQILPRHAGETIAITGHSGSVRVLLAHAFAMPLSSIFTFDQDYCCINTVEIYPSGRTRVCLLNSTVHLGNNHVRSRG